MTDKTKQDFLFDIADKMRILSVQSHVDILHFLSKGKANNTDIKEHLQMSASNISGRMNILRKYGFVKTEQRPARRGRQAISTLKTVSTSVEITFGPRLIIYNEHIARIAYALSSVTRLKIIQLLIDGIDDHKEIAKVLNQSVSNISIQLKKLIECGIVELNEFSYSVPCAIFTFRFGDPYV